MLPSKSTYPLFRQDIILTHNFIRKSQIISIISCSFSKYERSAIKILISDRNRRSFFLRSDRNRSKDRGVIGDRKINDRDCESAIFIAIVAFRSRYKLYCRLFYNEWSLKRSAIVKLRSRSGSAIVFQMAIGIAIAIAISNEDRDRDRDLNFDDRAHALIMHTMCLIVNCLFSRACWSLSKSF